MKIYTSVKDYANEKRLLDNDFMENCSIRQSLQVIDSAGYGICAIMGSVSKGIVKINTIHAPLKEMKALLFRKT